MLLLERKVIVFEGLLVGSGWGMSLWGYVLQGRRRLQAAVECPEPPSHQCLLKQVSDLDDGGWRMLCNRGVWQDGAQQAEASISSCNAVQIHASVSSTSRRLSSRLEQPNSNSFPWELLPGKEEGSPPGHGAHRGSAGAMMGAGCWGLQKDQTIAKQTWKTWTTLGAHPHGSIAEGSSEEDGLGCG